MNLMQQTPFAQSPFAALTFVAAPALLTNASSVLAMSTINRMLRTRDQMTELLNKSEAGVQSETDAARLVELVNHVETQAALLLSRVLFLCCWPFASQVESGNALRLANDISLE
jgi:hypothetical protein